MKIENSFYSSGKFQQRIRNFFSADNGLPSSDVLCVAYDSDGILWAGTQNGLAYFDENGFKAVELPCIKSSPVQMIYFSSDSSLFVGSANSLFRLSDNKKFTKIFESESPIVAMAEQKGSLLLLTQTTLYREEKSEFLKFISVDGGNAVAIAANDNTIYVATENALLYLAGKRYHWKGILPQFTDMPNSKLRSISFDAIGYLWVGTDDGLCLYDNKSYWLTSNAVASLPADSIRNIVKDSNGGNYFASDNGVIYMKDGALKYLGSRRWVPSNDVRCVTVSKDCNTVWAATSEGLSQITCSMMSLKDKADYYQKLIEKYHTRDGYVTVRSLSECENMDSGNVEISDNDGLWTGRYVASLAYRYAVTGDKKALELAKKSMKAMLYLTKVSGISGFTARAIRRPGEKGFGNGDSEWIPSSDATCEWKCETSSDEMVGHFYCYSVYYDLCANEDEKSEIKAAVCGIVDHIIDNNFRLVDHDGLPTTWAVWAPESLNLDDKWIWEKGVNSLEILSFLKVAYYMSNDEKYNKIYKNLITNHHYLLNAAHHKVFDGHVTHIDDNLGFLSTVTILRLEKDESIRSLIFMGLEHHWQYERIERFPHWNLIYGAFTNRPCDLESAVQSLREMPLNLIRFKTINSTRKNLFYDTEQEMWGEPVQLKQPLPFDERPLAKDDHNPFLLDAGDGFTAEDGTMFLLPYWFARYYKLIKETDAQ